MRNIWSRFIIFGALSSVALFPVRAFAQKQYLFTSEFQVVQKADLPTGGITVPDAARHLLYYYVNTNSKGAFTISEAGLYGSHDEGKTWYWLSGGFDFANFFVHPTTGELFAISDYKTFSTKEDGMVIWSEHRTALRSDDGKQWKNLLAKHPENFVSSAISVDPEHPNRIRLIEYSFRAAYLVATDDNYSNWKRVEMGGTF